MTLQQLREKRAAAADRRKALHEAALAEVRDFSADEQTEFDRLAGEMESLGRQIDRAELIDTEQDQLGQVPEPRTRGANTSPRIEVRPPELSKDPFGGYASGEIRDPAKVDTFTKRKWFGEFAVDVAGAKGAPCDRLNAYQRTALAAGDGMTTTIGHEGGYLIPTAFGAMLDGMALETEIVRPRATRVPMSTPKIEFPAIDDTTHSSSTVFGGVAAYFKSEEAALTSSKPAIKTVELALHKLTAMAYVTGEMLDWSPISIGTWLPDKLAQAIGWKRDDKFITGNGGAGEPTGLLNSACIIAIDAETGQAAATIVFENVIKMDARLWGLGRRSNVIWICNRTCKPQLSQMHLAIGTAGVPVFMPANGAMGQPSETLYNYPIAWTEHASALGTAGDIILANVGEYLVGETNKDRSESNMGLKFDYDQVAFRVITYTGGVMPWRSAFTPQNGDTLSPVISLATRS